MNKLFFVGSIIFLSAIAVPVLAHTEQIEGSISAVLHVEPDHQPVTGQPATVQFTVTDTGNHFDAQQCACEVTVLRDGQPVGTIELRAQAHNSLHGEYVFLEEGLYELGFSGSPKDEGSFASFHLHYEVNVGQGVASPIRAHAVHIIIFGVALVFITIVTVRDIYHKRRVHHIKA